MAEEAQNPETQKEEQSNLPENRFDVEDAGTCRKKITVTIPRERIDAKYNEMFGELAGSAQIPGFRVGHAPRRLVEKRFGADVGQDVRNSVIGEALGEFAKEVELSPVGEPDLQLEDIELPEQGDFDFSFEIEVAPDFELPQIEGIEVKKPKIEVTDERIDEQLDQIRQSSAKFEAADEPAAEGDVLTADVTISGEGIDAHTHEDHVLRVAPGQVEGLPLVNLSKELSGKKAGQTATTSVEVPASHPNEEWRGKKAEIKIALKEVRRRQLPELDDEFAKGYGFDSLGDLREQVRVRMEGQIESETRRAMRDQVSRYLVEKTDLELPEDLAARHADGVLRRQYIDLLRQGVPRERIDERMAELQAAATEQAQHELKLQFILGKIADKQEIEVSEDEINSRIAMMAAQYDRRPERLRSELEQQGQLDDFRSSIREEQVLENLLDKANVIEVDPEQLQKEQEEAQESKSPKKKSAKAKKPAKEEAADEKPEDSSEK